MMQALPAEDNESMAQLVIHGGAGTIPRETMTPEAYAAARTGLQNALSAGWAVLSRRGSALDAVTAAVVVLEDEPCFNAGHGAVLNAAGEHELDAAIVDGRTLGAGAVASARHPRNPILLARAIMEQGDHVLLAGGGADAFAREQGLALVEQDYFTTPLRLQHLQRARDEQAGLITRPRNEAEKHGTVGAVALDDDGNLAAATSTGGYTNKRVGRVGDSPIIGAGTYARNGRCAVSCTGLGEFFIRYGTAGSIGAAVALAGKSLDEAAHAAIDELTPHGAGAGLVAVGADGSLSMVFNTLGMYRGSVSAEGLLGVGVYRDDFEVLEKIVV